MGVLQRFERRLGGLVEGAFAKVFKSGVQPAELAAALTREADDKRTIAPHRTLVPNAYLVELAPADHERLAEYADEIGDELAQMVREHAQEQRYSFVGPVTVGFEPAEDLDIGIFRIRSSAASRRSAAGPSLAPEQATARLQVDGGRDVPLGDAALTIGRGHDCDLRLEDSGVSRRHARIEPDHADGGHTLTDLESTNGTLVNGRPVRDAQLQDGDRIQVGSTTMVYRRGTGVRGTERGPAPGDA